MRGFAFLIVLGLLAGCSDFPELDGLVAPGLERAGYPALVPVEPLIAAAQEVQIDETAQAGLAARVARLRARAARLRGPIVDDGSRARMRAGVPPIAEG